MAKIIKKSNSKPKNRPVASAEIRRLGIIVERIDDRVGLVAEQYGDINKELDPHTETIGSLTTDLGIVKEGVGFIKSSLKREIDVEEFAALEKRVSAPGKASLIEP